MQEKVREVSKVMNEKWGGYEPSEFIILAQEIASMALGTFSGRLLRKALAIAEAVAGFENELLLCESKSSSKAGQ